MAFSFYAGALKAQEAKYFNPEQEQAVLKHREELKRAGRLDGNIGSRITGATAGNVLPEILAHELPLDLKNKTVQRVSNNKGYYVSRPTNTMMSMAAAMKQKTIYDDMLVSGTSVKTGRGKWGAAQTGGAQLFNVADAKRLIEEEAAKQVGKSTRLMNVNPVKPMPIANIAGIPLKLFPEPTAGRAFFWGTVLAVWLGSATATFTCKQLNIQTADDIRPAFSRFLDPIAANLKEKTAPWKVSVQRGDADVDASGFSQALRSSIMKS